MDSKAHVFAHLLRQCRMLRMSMDVDVARAALDVEQDLVGQMRSQGLQLPDAPAPAVRRRNRRSAVTVATAAVAGGAA